MRKNSQLRKTYRLHIVFTLEKEKGFGFRSPYTFTEFYVLFQWCFLSLLSCRCVDLFRFTLSYISAPSFRTHD